MAFYVTTPIYYVNAAPHLGHAYTTIGADILARHMRQRGEDVFFLTGTDEHGEPVAQAAEREGISPKELADRNAERFRDLMPRINASNDFFIRTTDDRHEARVQEVMQRVYDNGYAYKGTYEGWYCPRCADFKTETEIGPGNTCPIHRIPLDREREENWFFRLSAFQEPLERLYAERPDFVLPRQRFNEALAFITGGLQDVSLSRAKLTWGIPVPWDPQHVFYVWFDALLNYFTALGFARDGVDLTSKFWPATYHVMAKDILKFHCVYWPALLLAADLPLPEHVFVHGYLLMKDASGEEHKMSKSLGNVLDPFEVMEKFGTDALRYYCFREVSFGQDGSVSTATFGDRYETELANELGNLASRTTNMLVRYRDGVVPDAPLDPELEQDFAGLADEVAALLDRAELTQALDRIWQRVRRLNRYVEEQAPWQLAKDPDAGERLDIALRSLAEGLRVVGVLLHPYMPQSTATLLGALGADGGGEGDGAPGFALAAARLGALPPGARVSRLEPLFPKPQ
jgi:methionyl-tRNA synthetase